MYSIYTVFRSIYTKYTLNIEINIYVQYLHSIYEYLH